MGNTGLIRRRKKAQQLRKRTHRGSENLTHKDFVKAGLVALSVFSMMKFVPRFYGRGSQEITNPTPIVYRMPSMNEQSEEVVVTSSQEVSQSQENIESLIPEIELGEKVNQVYTILGVRDVLYKPTLEEPKKNTAFWSKVLPSWIVDIDCIYQEGQYGQPGYLLWGRITVKGDNPELDNGWILLEDWDNEYALTPNEFEQGKELANLVNDYLKEHHELKEFEYVKDEEGKDKAYHIYFKNQEEALYWAYLTSEGNIDKGFELIEDNEIKNQQYIRSWIALLNLMQNDERVNGDRIKQRLASNRYHGVLKGSLYHNYYIQASNHPNDVFVYIYQQDDLGIAGIGSEHTAIMRAIIGLAREGRLPRLLPENYRFIVNPGEDGLDMFTSFGLSREDAIRIGSHWYAHN